MTSAMVRRWSVALMMMIVCGPLPRGGCPARVDSGGGTTTPMRLKGDFEAFANFTHPKLIEMFGGRRNSSIRSKGTRR